MRYIIIPLLTILYSWWSYNSIKDLINNEDGIDDHFMFTNPSILLWLTITIAGLFSSLIIFSIFYW